MSAEMEEQIACLNEVKKHQIIQTELPGQRTARWSTPRHWEAQWSHNFQGPWCPKPLPPFWNIHWSNRIPHSVHQSSWSPRNMPPSPWTVPSKWTSRMKRCPRWRSKTPGIRLWRCRVASGKKRLCKCSGDCLLPRPVEPEWMVI